jgi:hypothetical protein
MGAPKGAFLSRVEQIGGHSVTDLKNRCIAIIENVMYLSIGRSSMAKLTAQGNGWTP